MAVLSQDGEERHGRLMFPLIAQVPNPADSDLGKLVLGLGFLLVIGERAYSLATHIFCKPAKLTPLDDFWLLKDIVAEHKILLATLSDFKQLKTTVDDHKMMLANCVTRMDLQRLENQVTSMVIEHKDQIRSMLIHYEEQNKDINNLRVSLVDMRRETGAAIHTATDTITDKLETLNSRNLRVIQAFFKHTGFKLSDCKQDEDDHK